MLSDQTLFILQFWARLGHRFGASPLEFDIVTKCFYVSSSPSLIRDFKATYKGIMVWMFVSFTSLVKFLLVKDMDKYNITFFFWLCVLTTVAAFSLVRWVPQNLCNQANTTIKLLTHIHGKNLTELIIVSLPTDLIRIF